MRSETGRQRGEFHRRTRDRHRPHRAERGREVDNAAHTSGTDQTHVRRSDRQGPTLSGNPFPAVHRRCSPGQLHAGSRTACCRPPHVDRTQQRHTSKTRDGGSFRGRVGGERQDSGEEVLTRDEAASGNRCRSLGKTRGHRAGRADERTRSRGDPLDPVLHARARGIRCHRTRLQPFHEGTRERRRQGRPSGARQGTGRWRDLRHRLRLSVFGGCLFRTDQEGDGMNGTAGRVETSARALGSVFTRALVAEFTKITTLRSWWIGVTVVLVLTVYFAHMGASLLVELLDTLDDGSFTDLDGSRVPLEEGVLDTVLSSPYQSVALFLPLVIANAVGQEYRGGQISTSVTAVPSRLRLIAAKLVTVSVLSVLVCASVYALSNVVLLLMLPPEGVAI